ncbi:MAG TPA: hypothetical protein VFQ39_04320 [Longimicrobium sp.]|nr:hypothetical protein [Longimicrobium sp.]
MGVTPTQVEVRVIASSGKFLGNDIGGAEVVIRDGTNGTVLASGAVRGGSGDTAAIMNEPRIWGAPFPLDDNPSVFTATIALSEPRLVQITAYGPLGSISSARRVTAQQWLVPGVDLTGDNGVVMVIPGLLVQILSPATHDSLSGPGEVQILANVAMMCGCPIGATSPDPPASNPWPYQNFTVQAMIYQLGSDSELIDVVTLAYTATSRFAGNWTVSHPGFYEVVVVARENNSANTGVDRATFFLNPPSSPPTSPP